MVEWKDKNMKDKFYIIPAIPYSNGAPHMGHAYEYVLADAIARYQRIFGKKDVLFSMGMDENAQKNVQKAKELGMPTRQLIDEVCEKFLGLEKQLSISNDLFIRTAAEKHKLAAAEVWNRLVKGDFIYKKTYTGKYCIGCEAFKTEKDLNEKGECLDHLKVPQEVSEENYFFRLTSFKDQLIEILQKETVKIYPEYRTSEMINFLKQEGLQDVSFSRPEKLLNWGIKVPGDDSQVIYVWCDALINYITSLGFPENTNEMNDYWNNGKTLHVIGKDILRFHAIYWVAMLLGADIALPKEILVHGFITSKGQKMSKTIGNVIDPVEVLRLYTEVGLDKSILGESFSSEVFRYFVLKNISPFDDGDFTFERMKELYNADLANGLGNLVNRTVKLCEKYLEAKTDFVRVDLEKDHPEFMSAMKNYDVMNAMNYIWRLVNECDQYMQKNEPFKVVKVDLEAGKKHLEYLREHVYTIARLLNPFMPTTSEKIKEILKENKMPEKPLFPRYE